MTISYCGKYKAAGQFMTKRTMPTPVCEYCGKDNYDGGKSCRTCRAIRIKEHKDKGKRRREERRRLKE